MERYTPPEKYFRDELYNSEQFTQYARELAMKQKVTGGTKNNFLPERLKYNDRMLHAFNKSVLSNIKNQYNPPATKWVVENFYLIEEHILLAGRHFSKKYNRELPCILEGMHKGLPRVYDLAIKFIAHTDAQIDKEALKIFFRAYQTESVLKLGELWAIPIMLRLGIIENLQRITVCLQSEQHDRDVANEWMDRLEGATQKRPSELIEIVSDMAKSDISLSSSFISEFYQRLSSRNIRLQFVREWFEQRLAEEGVSIEEQLHLEVQNQAACQLSVSHCINSLRLLNMTDWKVFVESLSAVEHILRNDPAAVYSRMDFSTRDRYRHVIEQLAQESRHSEPIVAQHALSLSEHARDKGEELKYTHVGNYLVGEGIKEFKQALGIKRTFRSMTKEFIKEFPLPFYVGAILLVALVETVRFTYSMELYGIVFDWKLIVLILLFIFPAGESAIIIVNWLSTLFVKPDDLPRLDFSKEISPESRTMVVIPTMITDESGIDKLLAGIEVHYLSNRDDHLYFALLTDFADSPNEKEAADSLLLRRTHDGIKELNKRYAEKRDALFYLFHRPRLWNEREKVWMGYERKRGKLMEFNALLRGGSADCFSLTEGDMSILPKIKYIITLDTDTQLPPETANRLIGTMEHPLNKPVFDKKRNVVIKGYGILQPRVGISLTSSRSSLFSRLFTGNSGIDPYTRTVSDVYQDVFHQGSFIGKGIYDVDVFEKVLAHRLPENKILSHDLLESTYVRSALLSDVEIYEHYPSGYQMDVKRRHRWIRGDWQLLQWLLPWGIDLKNGFFGNPVCMLGRLKIADNLRRSLVAPATLLFFIVLCLFFPAITWLGFVLVLTILMLPLIFISLTDVFHKIKEQSFFYHLWESGSSGGHQIKQLLFMWAMLPYEAFYSMDAILRTLWRLVFSHKHLLQWQTSVEADKSVRNSLFSFYVQMWVSPVFALFCGGALLSIPSAFIPAFPFLLLWLLSPFIAWFCSRVIVEPTPEISRKQNLLLHRIARKTWYFFESFVNQDENWLPPDNLQEEPMRRVASRTSPTNIGLSLLTNLAAYDFGYLTSGGVIERTSATFDTFERLEKFKGHLYNWYDTRTLEPLLPLYVSSVDSGNLAGHLITMAQGLKQQIENKIYSGVIFDGMLDTVRVMRDIDPRNRGLKEIEKELLKPLPKTISDAFLLLKSLKKRIEANDISKEKSVMQSWTNLFMINCKDCLAELLYLAPWLEIINNETESFRQYFPLYMKAIPEIFQDVPTLGDMPGLATSLISRVEILLSKLSIESRAFNEAEALFCVTLKECLGEAALHAGQRIKTLNKLVARSYKFSKMDFSFLFHHEKKMFTVGYNVSEQRFDNSYYDMLASEARLCSFLAIARGEVFMEHWFTLSRLLFISKNKPVLLSWSGSMFEYLMPLLVMPDFKRTLLDRTYEGVIEEQMAYGKKFNIPWGISESGFNRTDEKFNYQYKAFGIPSLGLKRGLSEELVVAPYATLLALMVAPSKACDNLEQLTKAGSEGAFGYYEAIDFTPSHLPPGESQKNIRSFMAHHQGMGLLAIVNVLKGNLMQKRFMADPVCKAYELLLQEQIPRRIAANILTDDSPFEIEGANPLVESNFEDTRVFKDSECEPEVNLLSNGRYQVMINSCGAGYSRWHNLAVTRWREDGTADSRGTFIYLREIGADKYWSAGYQPVQADAEYSEVKFTQAYAEFHQRYTKLDIVTTICVSPEDDIELRRIVIRNYSNKARRIEVTSFAEVVMAPQSSDEAHPAFSNLFVETRFIPELSALCCSRRPRTAEEQPPHLLHLMLTQEEQGNEISCETDRSCFIGRGNTSKNPLAMQKEGALSGNTGAVLDPVVSLRRVVMIPAGKSVEVYITLGMADTHDNVRALADKYQNLRMSERAFELAWVQSQVSLYQLNIIPNKAQLFERMAGALVYVNPSYRAEPELLRKNRLGQNGLWGYGISGDFPLVLLWINEMSGLEFVREIISAYAYWRKKGLIVELVILNEDTSVYFQSLHNEIMNLITSNMEGALPDHAGGIFIRRVENMPEEDILLLQSVARIILDAGKGSLAGQLSKGKNDRLFTPLFKPVSGVLFPDKIKLPDRQLVHDNGYGGFTKGGHEYIITLQKGEMTPAPWCNVLANENFGTVISETGGAYTWGLNAHEFRLTPWSNDPVEDKTGEAFYIRDEESGYFWSPTPAPVRGKTPYVIRHGFGYSVFEHYENGIYSELWVYVALDTSVKFNVLKLRNISGIRRRLSVTGYNEWVLAESRSKSLMHVRTEIDITTGILFARNYYNSDFSGKIAFMDVAMPRTVTGDRREFLGQNGTPANPAAMKNVRLSGNTGAGLDPCGAMQIMVELEENEEKEVCFRLGFANHKNEMRQLVARYSTIKAVRQALEEVQLYWERILKTVRVDTPDSSVNLMANGWLLYQTLSSRIRARSGYYQSGGAYGFRDQLQDVMALVHTEPVIVRNQIIQAAAHQFLEGDVLHWWHPPTDRGVRTHFSDDYLWLPYVACHYVNTVEDTGIWDEKIPFLQGRPLRQDEESLYDLFGQSGESATLYEHCVRSIRYGMKLGIHGLPLMGGGDWNDGMNRVGDKGKGESVWLAFFLYDILTSFSVVAGKYGDSDFAVYCKVEAEQLQEKIRQHAWDGNWYLRAWFDDGTSLGSAQNEECRIDSIPQSWSVISNAGDRELSLAAMEEVNNQLVDRNLKIIRLFSPPFDTSGAEPGYIKGYVPGVRENGGQYTHAAIWTVIAYAKMGDSERAWELFELINPIQHGDTLEKINIYKVEPYVVAADVYGGTQHPGRGGWTWYTGSASWMYRMLIETLLGINRRGNTLYLKPLLKKEWKGYNAHYHYEQAVYHISFIRITDSSVPRLLMDGQKTEDTDCFILSGEQQEHTVEMWVL